MKAKVISKEEKLCFAFDYMPVEKRYLKMKKRRNFVNICTAVLAGASLTIGVLFNPAVAVTLGIFGNMVLLPSMYLCNSKMQEIIETVNFSNITYKHFRKMERSGELKQLINEAKQLQETPAYIGIGKLTQSSNLTETNTIGKNNVNINTKDNSKGREN